MFEIVYIPVEMARDPMLSNSMFRVLIACYQIGSYNLDNPIDWIIQETRMTEAEVKEAISGLERASWLDRKGEKQWILQIPYRLCDDEE